MRHVGIYRGGLGAPAHAAQQRLYLGKLLSADVAVVWLSFHPFIVSPAEIANTFLQTLVGREHHYVWCGGYIAPQKLQAFVQRMGERYPLARNARQRSYDRKRGRAVVHLVVFPRERDVQWWLLSNAGDGGLADPTSPDAHVAKDARSSTQHIEFEEYVLLYANKKVPGKGLEKHRETSTWTWKLRSEVVTTIRASIEQECRSLKFGIEGTNGWGLRGLLDRQRRRPLFSGVRNQVIELHRYAHELWGRRRMEWQSRHPDLTQRYGPAAGALTPMKAVWPSSCFSCRA